MRFARAAASDKEAACRIPAVARAWRRSRAIAGLPSTAVCLGCHSQLLRDQPLLARGRSRGRAWAVARRLEVAALYGHFVDIVWTFLYPLLSLVDRHG